MSVPLYRNLRIAMAVLMVAATMIMSVAGYRRFGPGAVFVSVLGCSFVALLFTSPSWWADLVRDTFRR